MPQWGPGRGFLGAGEGAPTITASGRRRTLCRHAPFAHAAIGMIGRYWPVCLKW